MISLKANRSEEKLLQVEGRRGRSLLERERWGVGSHWVCTWGGVCGTRLGDRVSGKKKCKGEREESLRR